MNFSTSERVWVNLITSVLINANGLDVIVSGSPTPATALLDPPPPSSLPQLLWSGCHHFIANSLLYLSSTSFGGELALETLTGSTVGSRPVAPVASSQLQLHLEPRGSFQREERGGGGGGRQRQPSACARNIDYGAQIKAFPCRFKFKFSIKKDINCQCSSVCVCVWVCERVCVCQHEWRSWSADCKVVRLWKDTGVITVFYCHAESEVNFSVPKLLNSAVNTTCTRNWSLMFDIVK